MIDVLRAFWDGFTRPRLPALVGIFVVVLVLAAILNSSLLAHVDAAYLMAGPNDYGAELTSQVMRIRRSQADGATMVVHVGSSISQEAIDDPLTLNQELSADLGRPVHYWPLFMPDAALWDLGAMIDQIPPDSRGYAVIEVSPGIIGGKQKLPERFVRRAESVMDSPFIEEELRKAGRPVPFRSGLPLVDHAGFFSARRDNLIRWVLRRPRSGTENYQHRWTTATVRRDDQGGELGPLAENYAARADLNSAILEKIIRLAQSRGMKVILLRGHYRPGSLDGYPEITRQYLAHVDALSKKMNAPFIDPVGLAGLTSDDYLDRYHLWHRPERLKFQSAFVRSLADEIRREEGRHAS